MIQPLKNLNRNSLIEEVWQRQLMKSVKGKGNVKDMQHVLDHHLRGVDRVPALCYNDPTTPLAEKNLKDFEIIPSELLHCLKGLAC